MRNIGLMIGAVVFVITVLAGAFNAQICVPCLALVGGAAAGYLVVQRQRAGSSGQAARQGAQAGAMAGVGALLGHLVGGLLGAARLGPEGAAAQLAEIMRAFDLPPMPTDLDPTTYYVSATATSLCFGLFEVALMAAVGALAGMVAYQMSGGRRAATTPAGQ